ncbi:MAG: hypothetical protein HY597_02615 [Candidatus Omnitrophica bacterium]|nr:hypothetical protein [Candidatus Omnitrophota bacterium]
MRLIRTLLLATTLLVLAGAMRSRWTLGGLGPDPVSIAVVLVALRLGFWGGAVAGGFAGWWIGLWTPFVVWQPYVAMGLGGAVIGGMTRWLYRDAISTAWVASLGLVALNGAMAAASWPTDVTVRGTQLWLQAMLPSGVATAVVASLGVLWAREPQR